MFLSQVIAALRIELQDTNPDNYLHSRDDLVRAINKSVSLMSRIIPNRTMAETTIGGSVSGESLTISNNKGTLAHNPVEVGTVKIAGKTLYTDYTVNHLTGVVTGIGSSLPDDTYSVSYSLDSRILNLSSLVPDYIRIERIEYPAGGEPPTYPTFELIGDYLVIRGNNVSLTKDKQLRVIYLARWTPPDANSEGDFPSHLNDAVIIGSSGQALIFKAEKYVQEAVNAISTLSVPTAPTPPTLSFTDAETALGYAKTELDQGASYLDAGVSLINEATRGSDVGETYGAYASTQASLGNAFINQAVGYLRKVEDELSKYSSEVTSFGSETNAYANEVREQESKARNYLDIASRYLASGQAKIQEMLIMLGTKIEFPMTKALPAQRE